MRTRGSKLKFAAASCLALALICVSRGEGARSAQRGQGQEQGQGQAQVARQVTDPQSQQLIHSVEGPDLFRAYCASCHGQNAKGNGPVAPMLKATVPDLTVIAETNGGSFPAMRIRRIIVGEGMIASHGSREMPVWGPVFHQVEEDVDRGDIRVENLVKYLESIQVLEPSEVKPADKLSAENAPSGKQLFKQNCAACHGNDLKGNGPAPPPFKDVPPDLTMLARTHGGKLPEKYVEDVLRNGVVLPAHGPAEMPAWGTDFRARDKMDSARVNQRITNLIDYIKSHQDK